MASSLINQKAPDLILPATDNTTISISELSGRWIVLYFYPKDNTPGCTQEAQEFRDQIAEFHSRNTIILGISRDNLHAHHDFKQQQNLPFALLSDEQSIACRAYDVLRQKNNFGKLSETIERSTFLIDPSGIIVREWRKVKVAGHVAEILKTLRQLQSG